MKYLLIVALLGACATTQSAKIQCSYFNTDQVRADLASPFRTDREWFETIIKRMALNLDCWQGERK